MVMVIVFEFPWSIYITFIKFQEKKVFFFSFLWTFFKAKRKKLYNILVSNKHQILFIIYLCKYLESLTQEHIYYFSLRIETMLLLLLMVRKTVNSSANVFRKF